MSKNILETAREAGSFTMLLAAVDAAGFGDTLAEGGPFTVFAPTDEAFAKLPAGTVAEGHPRGAREGQGEAPCRAPLPRRQGQGHGPRR